MARDFRQATRSNPDVYVTDEPFNKITLTQGDKLVYNKRPVLPVLVLQHVCQKIQEKFDFSRFVTPQQKEKFGCIPCLHNG